jgi:hypothetical protein
VLRFQPDGLPAAPTADAGVKSGGVATGMRDAACAVAAGRSTDVATHHRLKSMGLISFLYFVPVGLVRTE